MYPPPRVIARDPKPNHPDADRDYCVLHYPLRVSTRLHSRRSTGGCAVARPRRVPMGLPWTMHSAAGASERLYEPVRPLQTRLPRIRTCCHAPNVATLVRLVYISSEDPSSVRAVLRAPRASIRWRCPARRSPRACEQSSSVAVHTIACSDVVSFEDESWDIPNV
jgi:hypothetical protein